MSKVKVGNKHLGELLAQTDRLVREAQWLAPIDEDGGNIEGNYRELSRRLRRLRRWALTTNNGAAASTVLGLLNGGR